MDEKVKLLDKKAADLTTRDNLKIVAGITVAFTVVPVVIAGGLAFASAALEVRRERKLNAKIDAANER